MVCGNVSISFRSSFSSGPLPSQKSFFYLGLLELSERERGLGVSGGLPPGEV
jgi:hypothetical protein